MAEYPDIYGYPRLYTRYVHAIVHAHRRACLAVHRLI